MRARAVELGSAAGQQELLAQMVGRGAPLPGGCRFTGGSINDTVAIAEYACGDGTVALELHPLNAAPSSALHTEQFAIVVARGTPPPELLPAVASLIRAHEASFDWNLAGSTPNMRVAPADLLASACGVVVLSLAVQYLIVRRRTTLNRRPWWEGLAHIAPALSSSTRDAGATAWPAIIGLVAAYLVSRLWSLTRLPVFVDEAYHIDWARDGLGRHLVPQILVGKWLPIQVMALFMLLPPELLFTARSASVSMGLATLLACVCINRAMFSWREGLLAGVIYVLLPFALFYDRLALTDIYVTACGAWVVYFSIAMITRAGTIYPLAMTLCAAGAIFSKPTGGLLLTVPLLVSVLLVERGGRAAYVRLALPTVIGGVALLGMLLAGGYGTNSVLSQSGFDPTEQLFHLRDNGAQAWDWLGMLLTPAAACGVLAATAWALIRMAKGRNPKCFVVALLLLAIAPYVVVAHRSEPRYLLFSTVPVSLLLGRAIVACASGVGRFVERRARSIGTLSRAVVISAIIALFARDAVPLDVGIVTSPESAHLPETERSQYITAWSSGYGLPELAAFLRQQARQAPITVIRFKSSGPAAEGLNVYLTTSDPIRLYSVDHTEPEAAARIAELATLHRTFFVSNRDEDPSQEIARAHYVDGGERIWSYARPGAQSGIDVWELRRQAEP